MEIQELNQIGGQVRLDQISRCMRMGQRVVKEVVVGCRELGIVHSSRFYGSVRFTPDFGQNNFDPLPLADSPQVTGTPIGQRP